VSPGWLTLGALLALLAMLPWGVKWLQRRMTGMTPARGAVASKVVSALAVGPHQQVVTVEVGPNDDRVRLVLGVTAQSITCLHRTRLSAPPEAATAGAGRDLTA